MLFNELQIVNNFCDACYTIFYVICAHVRDSRSTGVWLRDRNENWESRRASSTLGRYKTTKQIEHLCVSSAWISIAQQADTVLLMRGRLLRAWIRLGHHRLVENPYSSFAKRRHNGARKSVSSRIQKKNSSCTEHFSGIHLKFYNRVTC